VRSAKGASAPTVLRVGRLVDGTGGRARERAELRIVDGRIDAIGDHGSLVQPGDIVVERLALTCTPGFLDVHTHMCYPVHGEFQRSSATPGRLGMLVQGFEQAGSWLRQGVTTARDVGTAFDLDIELAELISDGRVPGPRLAPAGRMMTMTGGKRNAHDHMKDEVSGAVAARRWTREHLKRGAVVIKLYCTTLLEEDVAGYLARALASPEGAPDPGRWASLSVDEIRAVTHEAHKLGRTVAAHTAPAFGVKLALRGGVDTVEHGSDLDDECIDLFLETGATLVPTLSVSHHQIVHDDGGRDGVFKAFSERRWDRIQANVAKAAAAGVKLATGTDPVIPGMEYRSEIELLVGCGLSPHAALLAATRDAAACLGLFGQDVGTLEAGKHADLLLMGADPTEGIGAIRDLREVWQGGVSVPDVADPVAAGTREVAHA
jgi:imidazolonepropionase-like amidohydrolase